MNLSKNVQLVRIGQNGIEVLPGGNPDDYLDTSEQELYQEKVYFCASIFFNPLINLTAYFHPKTKEQF
jgi:hypothetical protein